MALRTKATWFGVVLDAPDPRALAAFYQRLLDWRIYEESDTWVTVAPDPLAGYNLAIQLEPLFVPPVWPAQEGSQQMQAHLDIAVDDLGESVVFATECGATVAQWQPQDDVRVMLDPVGHVFCLYLDRDAQS